MQILKWTLLVLLALFVIAWAYFRFFMHFGATSEEIAAKMKTAESAVSAHTYKVGDQTMHYMEGGTEGKPAVIFVHGSPGNWEAWSDYFTDTALTRHARVFAIDRLGYGGSAPGVPVASLEMHAASIKPLAESLRAVGPVVLVGHSMGGPIVARCAMDFPDKVSGVLILAGSADPALEKVRFIQHVIKYRATRWLAPPDLDMSNRELLPHDEELTKMIPLWAGIAAPVTIMQGQKDVLVPRENAEFVAAHLTKSPPKMIRFPNENHFIVWTQHDSVRMEILEMIQKVSAK